MDSDIEISAKTVGELCKVSAWPDNLAIATPQDGYPESTVRVSKANVAPARHRSRRRFRHLLTLKPASIAARRYLEDDGAVAIRTHRESNKIVSKAARVRTLTPLRVGRGVEAMDDDRLLGSAL
jgi:hypothetical protein